MDDDIDRLLRALPKEAPSPALASTIRAAVHRRHRRRRAARRGAASILGLLGLWLVWPGVVWISSGEMYASSTSWLLGGLAYLNSESVHVLDGLWSGVFSVQNAIGSSLALSIWLGAFLLCCAIFLALDSASWQSLSVSKDTRGSSGMLASSLHLHT